MMPGFDGTGPMGTGPVGRRMGPCSNSGYINPVSPRYGLARGNMFYGFRSGYGRGFGMGRKLGMGYGRGFGIGYGRGRGRGWW
ncbi:hypothetical protein JCM30566_10050 [Marinitoga arctica]